MNDLFSQPAFHNTINEHSPEVEKSEAHCKYQDSVILEYFKQYPDSLFSPPMVHLRCGLQNVPLTSIRRSMCNLTKQGLLVKTDSKVIGDYGKLNYCWTLKK